MAYPQVPVDVNWPKTDGPLCAQGCKIQTIPVSDMRLGRRATDGTSYDLGGRGWFALPARG